MAVYQIKPNRETLHGSFSRDFEPIITIDSGDTVQYQTFDVRWGYPSDEGKRVEFPRREGAVDAGHALCGPIWMNGAKPGMTLEIRMNEIIPGPFGYTLAGGRPNWQNQKLDLVNEEEMRLEWELDREAMIGRCHIKGKPYSVKLQPFMGIIGMPPDEPGIHKTFPPRFCGGNIDCKELIKGSSLYLPIPVEGGLFSVGDGHAAQGDGEVSLTAIECPMDFVDLTFYLHEDKKLNMPRAKTPNGWLTFGFDEDLNEATIMALDGMLDLMGELYGLERVEAIALSSAVLDLRITQMVNGTKGVHAFLAHGAIR